MCARTPRVRVKRNLDARSDRLLYGTWHFFFFFFLRNSLRYGFDKLSSPFDTSSDFTLCHVFVPRRSTDLSKSK